MNRRLLVAALALAMLSGCGMLPRREAVPRALTNEARTIVCPGSRFFPNLDLRQLYQYASKSVERERSSQAVEGTGPLPPANYLAISGGGDAGAFGAGLLVGWTAQGNRPEFKVVTGVSAGALIAPFAYLGSDYDEVLRHVALSIGPRDVFHRRSIVTALVGDAVADDTPLAKLIDKYVTPSVLEAIAREYAKGRVLLIGTTDLDAPQPVVWNMGEIASCEDPQALTLFRRIMLASSSIPGIFPPVMIDVAAAGHEYQEMHADGGVISQVFLFPPSFVRMLTSNRMFARRERVLYVIRNGRIELPWQSVKRLTASVAHRAVAALIETQGVNDLYQLEVIAKQEGQDFNVAYIGDDFTFPHKTLFGAEYMRRLFEYSYASAQNGASWRKMLPGDDEPIDRGFETAGPAGEEK